MRRVDGSIEVLLLECVNPKKNKWRVRWDVQKTEGESNSATYMEEEFYHQPTIDEIKSLVIGWYNSQINKDILSGMTYNGVQVWLSSENQFNYKAAFDLAIQTKGKSLPVIFKFGTEDEPVYKQFNTLNELTNFYKQTITHIQNVLAKGWQVKDSIDFSKYKNLPNMGQLLINKSVYNMPDIHPYNNNQLDDAQDYIVTDGKLLFKFITNLGKYFRFSCRNIKKIIIKVLLFLRKRL